MEEMNRLGASVRTRNRRVETERFAWPSGARSRPAKTALRLSWQRGRIFVEALALWAKRCHSLCKGICRERVSNSAYRLLVLLVDPDLFYLKRT